MSRTIITVDEVVAKKADRIPQDVFDVFNALIAKNFDGRCAVVKQKEVLQKLENLGYSTDLVIRSNWLDIEDVYQGEGGWEVEYDKPGFNESYNAIFTFSRPRRR
jgi:hypothetical protein